MAWHAAAEGGQIAEDDDSDFSDNGDAEEKDERGESTAAEAKAAAATQVAGAANNSTLLAAPVLPEGVPGGVSGGQQAIPQGAVLLLSGDDGTIAGNNRARESEGETAIGAVGVGDDDSGSSDENEVDGAAVRPYRLPIRVLPCAHQICR